MSFDLVYIGRLSNYFAILLHGDLVCSVMSPAVSDVPLTRLQLARHESEGHRQVSI